MMHFRQHDLGRGDCECVDITIPSSMSAPSVAIADKSVPSRQGRAEAPEEIVAGTLVEPISTQVRARLR